MNLTRNPNRKIINFAAGPAAIPYEVLERVKNELIDYNDMGISLMELSHRSGAFAKVIAKAEKDVRTLLNVPDNYKVIFTQGGGNGQFSAVPINLIQRNNSKSADYFVTGYWSDRAYKEAQKYGDINLVLPKTDKFLGVVDKNEWKLNPNASYIYICDNETINGVEYDSQFYDDLLEKCNGVPLVADCSSNLFSKPVDVTRYGCIFACAQKNFGPAGLTLVIVRDDLLDCSLSECPNVMSYKVQAGNNSLYQTPPTFNIYFSGIIFEWLLEHGGLEKFGEANKKKSDLIYETISESNGFYASLVDPKYKSRVTIPFRIVRRGNDKEMNEKLEKEFIEQADKMYNLKELKGHRSVGGVRAAIYNAITFDEIKVLCSFMNEFKESHS